MTLSAILLAVTAYGLVFIALAFLLTTALTGLNRELSQYLVTQRVVKHTCDALTAFRLLPASVGTAITELYGQGS